MKYARIVAEFYSRAWAIREETLLAMQELLRLQAFECVKWNAEEIRARIADANAKNGYVQHDRGAARFVAFDQELEMEAASGKRNAATQGSVAVIPIIGIISHRMNMMDDISGPGGTSVQKLTAQFRQALGDGNCKAIVFDVDSPGGSVEGVPELGAEIFEARNQKPITAVFNSMGCSAAYWLASAAGEVVCTPSGQCGSIGVYMVHHDESEALKKDGIKITMIKAGKYKTEGNPSEPLSDEARAAFQAKVDDYYSMFVKAVARNRGASQASVRDGYGQGRSLLAEDAVKQKLADRIATFDAVLEGFGVKSAGAQASEAAPEQGKGDIKCPVAALNVPDDDEDEDDLCGCACEACKASNHGECSNAECADPNCGHEPRSNATAKEQVEIAAVAGDWLKRIESRRRQIELL